jgi:hypothetical protein
LSTHYMYLSNERKYKKILSKLKQNNN